MGNVSYPRRLSAALSNHKQHLSSVPTEGAQPTFILLVDLLVPLA